MLVVWVVVVARTTVRVLVRNVMVGSEAIAVDATMGIDVGLVAMR